MATLTKTGNVRANKSCPFLKRCSMRCAKCPQRGNLQPTQFKCPIARLFQKASTIVILPQIERIEQLELPALAQAVEAKQAERYAGKNWIELSLTERLGV